MLDRKSEQDIRLVSYNTLNEGILDPNRQSHFRRIIQALDPDIIALQEHSEWGSIEDIIQSWFPNDDWNASWTYGDLVVLSNFSIISHTQLSSDRSMAVLIETVDRIAKIFLFLILTYLAVQMMKIVKTKLIVLQAIGENGG